MSTTNLKCYKLVGGQYIGADFTQKEQPLEFTDGKPKLDRRGQQIHGHPSRKFNVGEIVVSPIDLRAKHINQFEYVGPYETPNQTVNAAPPAKTKTVFYSEAELNEMSLEQLTALAAEEEVQLPTSAKTKPAIVKALIAAKS